MKVRSASLANGIDTKHVEFVHRIAIFDRDGAHFDAIRGFELNVRTRDPERIATLIDFIGDSQEIRVECLIQAGVPEPERIRPVRGSIS